MTARSNSPATGAPTISGTAQVDETLRAHTSGIADEDGLDNASFSFQWIAGDADIPGATSSTYTVRGADEGQTIQVRVSFTDDANNPETLTSVVTRAVDTDPQQSYITVVVSDENSDSDEAGSRLTVSWYDRGSCSSEYNAYLYYQMKDGTEIRSHLGSAPTDDTQIAKSISI